MLDTRLSRMVGPPATLAEWFQSRWPWTDGKPDVLCLL
jgi:hypothetical protein